VSIQENPIFLTQKRLVHRSGVLAAVLIAALIGLSLLSGLIAYLAAPIAFNFHSPQEAGKTFYGWVIGVEILVLVLGGFSRIARSLADDRKAGLWDSNRLTPLKPSQLVIGYWFGSPLREFYMGAALAGIGLIIIVLGKLSLTLWLGTQILIASTALFFGLLAVLVGMAFQRPQSGVLLLIAFVFLQTFSFSLPKFMVTNFILPIYGIANLFNDNQNSENDYSHQAWGGLPQIFGFHIYPILLSLGLQLVMGILLWRAAVRKTANPFQPLLLRWEALAMFGIIVAVQHGLMWGIWHGQFPTPIQSNQKFYDGQAMLPIVHIGTILIAVVLLAFASPQPERVRVEAMRFGFKNLGAVFSRSAASLAIVLAAIVGLILFTQCAWSFTNAWKAYVVAVGNLLDFFLIFALLLEFCRLRFQRRALGFVALWLFILCALPFVLAGVFSTEAIGRMSLLSPGVVALGDPNSEEVNYLLGTVLAHFGVVVLLFIAWRNQWNRLLGKPMIAPPP